MRVQELLGVRGKQLQPPTAQGIGFWNIQLFSSTELGVSKTGERGESVVIDSPEVLFLTSYLRQFRSQHPEALLVLMTYPEFYRVFMQTVQAL